MDKREATRKSVAAASEGTLLARAREGDERAFEQLLRRNQRAAYTLAVRILHDRADAEDACQEAALAAWRRLPGFRGDASFSTWLGRIVVRRSLNIARSRRRAVPLDTVAEPAGPSADTPARRVEGGRAVDALRLALAELTPEQRACWLLREIRGMCYHDVAVAVGASETAVRGRIGRARRQLAEAMQPWR
jgi:RNA polymerase sigma-70 factor (ECF subfamily)